MLVFDQLKREDPQLRVVTLVILSGFVVLLIGLWWVQVVSASDYQANLETQSFRTVRIPAVRGRILDMNGQVLAENRPTYDVCLYLEDLRKAFDAAYTNAAAQVRSNLRQRAEQAEARLHRRLTKQEKKEFTLSVAARNQLRQRTRYEVASNVVAQVGQRLGERLSLDPVNFQRHYETRLALPYPIVANLGPTNIARIEEQSLSPYGVDLVVQSTRFYPEKTVAAHVLGRLQRDDSSMEGEEAFFSYRLPDFRGLVGIEAGFDRQLRGMAGAKSVLVNNLGFRQTENIWTPAEPGHNVVLTIDLRIQRAAESALQKANASGGSLARGAVVVMDVNTGDILAMASSPALNPNWFVQGVTHEEWAQVISLHAEQNCATQGSYMPGSIFKTIVGLACLEAGLNPHETYHNEPNPRDPSRGHIMVGNRLFHDTAPAGDYNFRRALKLSSNAYFIHNGLKYGPERIVRLAQHLHFGERTGLPTRQEVSGSFPTLNRVNSSWKDGNTANLSIGQDPVYVNPLQIAVMTSALANGGKVLWPRLVQRIEPQDPMSNAEVVHFPNARVRDQLGVSARNIAVLHEAMVADTEDTDGTGRASAVPGLRICGKTGTATVQDERGAKKGKTTWFASFAPYDAPGTSEKPRWAVVVMVEDGTSGGGTCAPVAHEVYLALKDLERGNALKPGSMATIR